MAVALASPFTRSAAAADRRSPPAFINPAGSAGDPVPPSPPDTADAAAHQLISRADVRALTPRQMSALCGELFLATMISCDEYLMMAFQPELHPDYDRTIGALIGEKADPDRPRDYVRRWTDRVEFEARYNAGDPAAIARARNILAVLRHLDAARNRSI